MEVTWITCCSPVICARRDHARTQSSLGGWALPIPGYYRDRLPGNRPLLRAAAV